MSMVIQNNLNAINAHNKLGTNVIGTKKATEKLSSGFRINRAADDAAGLAISEKMRAQLRGIGQAIRNANDGISLIQTAEGALDETHAMLKRLKELAVLAGNDTYTNEEREYAQMEINDIKEEIDRISKATDFNGIKLLDGSLDGGKAASSTLGPRYAVYLSAAAGITDGTGSHDLVANGNINLSLDGAVITSNVTGVTVELKSASTLGGENAMWDKTGKVLTINLFEGQSYDQAKLNDLIANASQMKATEQGNVPADVTFTLKNGSFQYDGAATFTTVTGTQAASGADFNAAGVEGNLKPYLYGSTASTDTYADTIRFIANNFGVDDRQIKILTDSTAGEEKVVRTSANNESRGIKDGEFTLHLSTGIEYTTQDIENLLRKAGLDYTVELTSSGAVNKAGVNGPSGDVKFLANTMVGGAGASGVVAGSWNTTTPTVAALGQYIQATTTADTQAKGQFFGKGGVTIALTGAGAQAYGIANFDVKGTVGHDLASDSNVATANLLRVTEMWDGSAWVTAAGTGAVALTTAQVSDGGDFFEVGGFNIAGAVGGEFRNAAQGDFMFKMEDGTIVIAAGQGSTLAPAETRAEGWARQDAIAAGATAAALGAAGLAGGYLASAGGGGGNALTLDMSTVAGNGVGADKGMGSGDGLTFQIGANNAIEQRVTLNIKNMGSAAIGIGTFDISTSALARQAMDNVEKAIVNVSRQRASLGAMQNRLEHTVNSLTTTHENLTAAESQIRDTDMAKEMVQYTKFNILQQAAQAMLAQANQAPQAVLQLLR